MASLSQLIAKLAGKQPNQKSVDSSIERLMDQQFLKNKIGSSSQTVPSEFNQRLYAYPYFDASDICYRQGVVGESVNSLCKDNPQYCLMYDTGKFKGTTFVVTDIFKSLGVYDGGAAFDQGWAGSLMIESLKHEQDASKKVNLEKSLTAAIEWSIAEPAVRNTNYTSKLVWLLAQAYNLTGKTEYKVNFLEKFERTLKAQMLTDFDNDGEVDGIPGAQFKNLGPLSQHPGRYWDGHNSLASYHAMNTWALVEAYVALRDRNQPEMTEVKKYMELALDNQALELLELGLESYGKSQIPIGLLLAHWKVSQFENKPNRLWEEAINRIWNNVIKNEKNRPDNAFSTALFLVISNQVSYTPKKLSSPDSEKKSK